MLNTDGEYRIRGSHGDAVVVDPAELIDLAEYLESITSSVYWEGKSICGTGNDVSSRLREIVSQSRPCCEEKVLDILHALSAATLT